MVSNRNFICIVRYLAIDYFSIVFGGRLDSEIWDFVLDTRSFFGMKKKVVLRKITNPSLKKQTIMFVDVFSVTLFQDHRVIQSLKKNIKTAGNTANKPCESCHELDLW